MKKRCVLVDSRNDTTQDEKDGKAPSKIGHCERALVCKDNISRFFSRSLSLIFLFSSSLVLLERQFGVSW
jgi:hypothetical protein